MAGKRLKARGLKVELRAVKTLETKMDKVPGGRRVEDGRKIGFRQAQVAGLYWGRGDRWNGYTGMERMDGLSHPTHKKMDFWHEHVVPTPLSLP